MDTSNNTPTTSGDEESGTQLPTSGDEESGTQLPTTITTEMQEQPIITEETMTTTTSPNNKPDDVIVVDVTKPTSPNTDKPQQQKKEKTSSSTSMTRRFDFATFLVIGAILTGLLIAAITIPIVMNNNNEKSASASGLSAQGDDGAQDDEPYVLDPSLPDGKGNTTPDGSTTSTSSGFEPLWKVSDSIGFYDESVVKGYADTADFQADLTAVAKMMINLIVARSTGTTQFGDKYNYWGGATPVDLEFSRQPMDEGDTAMPEESLAAADGGNMGAMPVMAPAMPAVGEGVNDFGSNNQEDSVEEGDKIVSDGTRVFASYGDYIIAWDAATGEQLAMVQMEKFKPPSTSTNSSSTTPVDASTGAQAEGGARMYDSMPMYPYEPKPTIMSLLLLDSRLIVAVDGGYWYEEGMEERIMSGYGQTRVIVYETENVTLDPVDNTTVLGNMTHLFSRDYNGQFVAFRAIGENLHTVTTSTINTYSSVAMPVERYNYEPYGQPSLTDEEYMDRVKADAEVKFIPNFVNKLTKELTQPDGTLPRLARISKYLTHTSDVAPEMDQYYLYDQGILNSVTLVHSMNVYADEPATSSSAGVFFPSYSASVYSSEEYMIMAGAGYDYSPFRMASTESTYLMAMKLNGDATTPYSVGTVEGSFLNQRSFDVVDNVLRVATTIQNFWRWVEPMPLMMDPMPMMMDPMPTMEAETTTSTTTTETSTSDAADKPMVLETDESGVTGSGGSTTGSESTPVIVDMPEPDVVADEPIVTETLPPMEDTQSSTENYIITLKLPSEDDENHGVMQELDRIKLGKPDEMFTSVRFFDNVAYAVTFERTDPFYVLNVTDPSDLQVLAEVNITGFSSYLHSMNDENNMILAIGQEADEFGMVLGLQISLFDVRDVNDIKVLRHTIESDTNTYSDTAATWDVMAIRFNRETGRLIIPVDISNWQQPSNDFHGFRVYSVTEEAIEEDEDCRVEMGNANEMTSMCFYCASLEPRAMIMNGNMMLTKSHFVKSIDMNTCTMEWQFAVNSTSDPYNGCCRYY